VHRSVHASYLHLHWPGGRPSPPAWAPRPPAGLSWAIDKIVFYVKTDFVVRDVVYLDEIEQAETLLKPQRIEVLRQLAEPRSCTEVAAKLDQTPQRVYYHVKRLLDASLVSKVSERRVRGIHEGIYQATGRSYWLSPRLVGRIGLRQARDRLSLGHLLDLMEDVQADVAALDLSRSDLPSIGVSGDIRVRPEQRAAFLDELQHLLRDLFTRYGGAEGDAFRLALACYPNLPRQTDVAPDVATSTDVTPSFATTTEGDSDDRAE